jgi:hypothetical protein
VNKSIEEISMPSLSHISITLLAAASATFIAFANPAFAAVDLGDASVLSQQGQRLKVAVVYGSGAGENVPVTRFSVAEIRADAKDGAPKAEMFTISQPLKRNIIFLQSKEIVRLEKLQLVMTAADSPDKKVVYDLIVPPAKSALAESEPVKAKEAMKKRGKSKSKMIKRKVSRK